MNIQLKKYSFDETYLPISQYLIIDEEKDTITRLPEDEIPYPETDGSILDAVIHIYLASQRVKRIYRVAHHLNLDSRDLSGAVHILTGMTHEKFLQQYRLRAITELLTTTKISTKVIAKHFGYSSLHTMNRFLTDQTGLTANEIRRGVNATQKVKRLAWWQK